MEFELGCDQVCKVAERLGCVENLRSSVSNDKTCEADRERHTFFITPTASSVWVTKSSSAASISALASALKEPSSSGFMPRAMTAFFLDAFVLSSKSLLFSTDFRAFAANVKFVLSVVFHPARNRD